MILLTSNRIDNIMDDRLEIINVRVGQVVVAEPELHQPGRGAQQLRDTRPVQTIACQLTKSV